MKRTEVLVPYADGSTWSLVCEPDSADPAKRPLIIVHGGPGAGHNYLRNLERITGTGRVVVFYDQIGCGHSTHHPTWSSERWSVELFEEEFHTLTRHLGLEQYHLLGQSWGGMLGAEIAADHPDGLRGLVIANSPASMPLWIEETDNLRGDLPRDVLATLRDHEARGDFAGPAYLHAVSVFNRRHLYRGDPYHELLAESDAQMAVDATVHRTMVGPNDMVVHGSLRSWSIIDRLHDIQVPTLVIAGEFDQATRRTWEPYSDLIPGAKTRVFAGASHCVHLEYPDLFTTEVERFLDFVETIGSAERSGELPGRAPHPTTSREGTSPVALEPRSATCPAEK